MFARDAGRFIVPPIIIGLAFVVGATATHFALGNVIRPGASDILLIVLAAPGALLLGYALFLLWFFRDPERTIGDGWVSPADGRVLFVEPHDDPDAGAGQRIAIFMSPLDVHVNRLPVAAELVSMHHRPGAYKPAFDKESENNERLVTLWRCHDPQAPTDAHVKLVQIAGAVARRIVPWVDPGATLAKGERYGMIRLGSRVDVYLPPGISPTVEAGQRVLAGQTTIARRT